MSDISIKESYSIVAVTPKKFSDEEILSLIKRYTNSTILYSKAETESSKIQLSDLNDDDFYDVFIEKEDGTIAQCTFMRKHNSFAYRRTNKTSVLPKSINVETNQSTATGTFISQDLAYSQAKKYIEDVDAKDLYLFSKEECVVDSEKGRVQGWLFTFTRKINDVQKIYSPGGYYVNPNYLPEYGSPWEQEFLKIVIDNQGLCQLWYEGASEIESITDGIQLKEFESIKKLAIEHLQKIFQSENENDLLDITITDFDLGMDLVSKNDSDDAGIYIPTWKVTFTYGYKNSENRSSMAIILNAIDGSYVEPRVTNDYLAAL